MSSNPSFSDPVLNYVGSVDISTSTSGSTLYNILFDSSLCTTGNVLMFEYKIQPADVEIPEPDNITLGYVNIENATFTSGIANQWTIAIPAMDMSYNNYNPSIPQNISVRVYSGLTGLVSPEIVVSPWSNSLAVHVPPAQPVIATAFYNDQYGVASDEIWVNMIADTANYNYANIKFIVAYYFQDANNETVWGVSDILTAVDASYGNTTYKQLLVQNIGLVNVYEPSIYAAVYAVYPYSYNGNNYYSVSEISLTEQAQRAGNSDTPKLTDIDYLVYDTPSSQTMVITWSAPENSVIPDFAVANYILQLSLDSGSTWNDISNNIPSNILSYPYDVSIYGCGTNLEFRVIAVTAFGESPPSNVEGLNIFRYAAAPSSVIVNWASTYLGVLDIAATFAVPENYDSGCGQIVNWVVQVKSENGALLNTQDITYNAGQTTYLVYFDNVQFVPAGTVTVFMKTIDTNDSYVIRDGASKSGSFMSEGLPIFENVTIDPDRILLQFDVLSQTLLSQVGRFIWTTIDGQSVTRVEVPFYTNNDPEAPGQSLILTTLENGVEQYRYTFTPEFFDQTKIPVNLTIAASNTVGIALENVLNPIV